MPNYRIADLVVNMDCGGRTAKQAEPYLTDDSLTPDFSISVSNEEIAAARVYNPTLPDDEWEYILSATAFYRNLIHFNGFMLHASAILYQARAYLFSAPSGTGKSTHTSLWQKAFGTERVRILNDDKPAIRRINDTIYAFGTPWSGKYDISIPIGVPVAGICFLERAEENSIAKITSREALPNLFSQTLRRLPDDDFDLLSDELSLLLSLVPIYRLQCNVSTEAALVAEKAMNRPTANVSDDPNRSLLSIREGYSLCIKAGSNIIACQDDFNFIGLTTLNTTGVFLFRQLETGTTAETLVSNLAKEYEIDASLAEQDVKRFLSRLKELKILSE